MTVTIDIPVEMERKLREEASRRGQELPEYIRGVLANEVAMDVVSGKSSIMQLHGIGKSVWHEVDVAAYIAAERESWDTLA